MSGPTSYYSNAVKRPILDIKEEDRFNLDPEFVGKFEGVEKITGERMAELRKVRGGRMHACMPTCPVGCSPIFNDRNGEYVTSAFEYESLAMLGSNLEIKVDQLVIGRL